MTSLKSRLLVSVVGVPLLLWLVLALLGGGLLGSALLAGRHRRKKQQTGETR